MPSPSITRTHSSGIHQLSTLNSYLRDAIGLESKYQYLVGEVLMLRLFSILEQMFCEVAYKLACGALYRNNTPPLLLRRCKSIQDAHTSMTTFSRTQPLLYLRWTKASYINDNVRYIIDSNDPFLRNIRNHGSLINEMRIVRNHIAHRSASTKQAYDRLIRATYGGNLKLPIGGFLMSTRRTNPSKISTYLTSTIVVLNDITQGV